MSDQNKSNFQALGAGLLGFVAVMAVGGGVLMLTSRSPKTAAPPIAAAAPIDLGSSMPRSMVASPLAQNERRAESPAPLIGDPDGAQPGSASATAASGGSASGASSSGLSSALAESEKAGSAKSGLEVSQHLDAKGASTSAVAPAKNALAADKTALKTAGKKSSPLAKLDASGAAPNAVASVHYGVTDRSELMGRAAGPVYNFQGANKAGASTAAKASAASGETKAKLAAIQKQLDSPDLPADLRAKLKKEFDDANAGVDAADKATAE